jgi:hypothetical protein
MTRLFLGLTLSLLTGQTSPPPSWRTFAPKDGSFTVALPGTPKEKKQQLTISGGVIDVTLYICPAPGEGTLVVAVSELPESAAQGSEDKRLRNARDGAVEQAKGKLVHERKITLAVYPGRELWIENDSPGMIHTRLFAVKQRLYQTMAIGPKSFIETKEVAGFLDSFQLQK